MIHQITKTITDWQEDEHIAKGAPKTIDLKIDIADTKIAIETDDGRSVGMELQNGILRFYFYSPETEEAMHFVSVKKDELVISTGTDHQQVLRIDANTQVQSPATYEHLTGEIINQK